MPAGICTGATENICTVCFMLGVLQFHGFASVAKLPKTCALVVVSTRMLKRSALKASRLDACAVDANVPVIFTTAQ